MTSDSEQTAVRKVVETYLHGVHEGDIGALKTAFHERSRLHALDDKGEVAIEDRDAWLARVAGRASPASKGEARDEKIESVVLAGAAMAAVKLQVQIGTHRYEDLLTLLRTQAGWRIATKTFRDATSG